MVQLNDFVVQLTCSVAPLSGFVASLNDLGTAKPVSEIIAAIKPETVGGTYKIRIAGNFQGASAMRVEYLTKGGTVPQSFFLMKMPAEITIVPTVAGQPESGHLRAFLLENNEEIGQPSPEYPITVG